MVDSLRVAVLLDCENVSHKLAGAILAETTRHGTLTVKRAYGDWSKSHMSGWRQSLARYAIQPFQQFSYVSGKNSSDAALIVDAMDLLYSANVDIFCLVSSDSDFTRLVTRIRESGRKVYGLGGRKTHESFVNAFDRFTFTEVLKDDLPGSLSEPEVTDPLQDPPRPPGPEDADDAAETDAAGAEPSEEPPPLPDLEDLVRRAVAATMNDEGWAFLATVGSYIVNNLPSFDSRNYGHAKLGGLMRSLRYVQVREVPTPHGPNQLQVSLRGGSI